MEEYKQMTLFGPDEEIKRPKRRMPERTPTLNCFIKYVNNSKGGGIIRSGNIFTGSENTLKRYISSFERKYKNKFKVKYEMSYIPIDDIYQPKLTRLLYKEEGLNG